MSKDRALRHTSMWETKGRTRISNTSDMGAVGEVRALSIVSICREASLGRAADFSFPLCTGHLQDLLEGIATI